jgi:DNA-binding CsgD family transcriptional regulator/PAS domain-containing protein
MISISVLSLALSTDVSMRSRIENQQRQRALETELLWQAAVQVSLGGSFEDLARDCLKRICRVTGWPAGHVYLRENVNNPHRFLSSSVWHFEREELVPLAREAARIVLELGEEPTDRKCATGKDEWLSNVSESAIEPRKPLRLKPRRQILLKHGLCAAFGFPIYADGKLQAVLEFFSTTDDEPDTHLSRVVQSIGEQLGRALERQGRDEQQYQATAFSDALSPTTIRSEALEATLNALTFGVYLTDRNGLIVYMNHAAAGQVTRNNAVRVQNNHFAFINDAAQLALTNAIAEAIDEKVTSGLTVALPGKEDGAGLIATVFPLDESQGMHLGMAAIFVQDPSALPSTAGAGFAELYNLTRSELRVLRAMVPGLSVKEAADMLGICETTAKTHLHHIYSKTGTSNRTELMHLVMSSTPPIKLA